jgi:hypothetical protein
MRMGIDTYEKGKRKGMGIFFGAGGFRPADTLCPVTRCFARHFTLGSVPSGYYLYTYSC